MRALAYVIATVVASQICEASSIVVPRDASPNILAAEALSIPLAAVKRTLPNSPSGGYAPAAVPCPQNRPTIRAASSLSPDETSWLALRRNNTIEPMISWLSRMNISGFDTTSYINGIRTNATALPNIGIAISGGGYRALMNGAGFIAAADSRTKNSTNTGQIGGLLQATTYLSGLSGGGWLVGSIYTNNFSTIQDLQHGSKGSAVWKFENSIFEGPGREGFQILESADYFSILRDQVLTKEAAGYNTTITDYWGRALSYQLINSTNGGLSHTFSSIALQDGFKNGSVPFPLIVADGRAPNTKVVSINSTVYEFNPFEMGSWDPTTYGFAPTRYLGSNFSSGVVPDNGRCVEGFDQAGYIIGTTSTLFNTFILNINSTALPDSLKQIFTRILNSIGESNNDIAQYEPNPFYHYNNDTSEVAQSIDLTLVDGGEDGQNVPLNPLIQPLRAVDVIFAVDSSADTTYFWPNGTSLVATYERSLNATIENGTAFPAIPDQNTFINLGLNNHPTFFGCNASNMTGAAPLIVYIPNAPYVTESNVSTFDPSYNNTQRNAIIRNGYEVATQGNGTVDKNWPACMACAVLSRSFTKTGTPVPATCQTCFDRYCWNGALDSRPPAQNYTPAFKTGRIPLSGASNIQMHVAPIVAVVIAMLFL